MILRLVTVGIFSLVLSDLVAQENSSGVFLQMKPSKNTKDYTKTVQTRDGSKKFYVPPNPVIPAKEFTKVSELTNDVVIKSSYFALYFSQKGIDNLKIMASKVESGQLVLVVDDIVIGEIKAIGVALNRSIQINGPLNSQDVLWAHTSLKKMMDERASTQPK